MKFQQLMLEGHCTADDFTSALDLAPVLREHGLVPGDDQTEATIRLAARLVQSPRSLTDIEDWLDGSND
jgi:hypothetical protein